MTFDSTKKLKELGYDIYYYKEPGIEPQVVNRRFSDFESFKNVEKNSLYITEQKLYVHQYQTYLKLSEGHNIILKSGTGSGKTEAWLLYALEKHKKVLVIYPTLALANDQIRRLKEYSTYIGFKLEGIDAKRRSEAYKNGFTTSKLRNKLSEADILVTNPAFLLTDLKRWASNSRSCVLIGFLPNIDLVVIDELDFYGPREIALLISMLKILRLITGKIFQIAILTATLGNPKEMASILTEINTLPTSIIDGKPFRVPNNVIIILGKNLRKIWNILRENEELILSVPGIGNDVKDALEDFEVFRNNVYKIVQIARGLQISVPNIYIDPIEILQRYFDDNGVTLVFTRSIARAEELSRKLRMCLPEDERIKVASHHHLISKELRERIEAMARTGEVKIVFSPRTLSQGIDIGTIIRIVHIGLPEDVREFHQREGRKGRRKDIDFTESIIIPGSLWDRELLSRGVDVLKQWMELPLENVIVNKDNKYGKLLVALFKFVSNKFSLEKDEVELLKELGLIEGNLLSSRGKRTWHNINFYEFAPPFGIKRIKILNGKEKYLEDISFIDLVEKFQVGSLDYTSDSVVIGHRLGGKSGRTVTAVIEKPITERVLWESDALSQAYEEYIKIKSMWGEHVNVFLDYVHGKLHSEVICTVYPPRKGFGKYLEVPNRVRWIVQGEKARLFSYEDRTIFVHERKVVEVPTPTYGMYEDFTYGRTVELDPSEQLDLIRIGIAYILLVLRLVYNISFRIFSYDIGNIGDKKILTFWEESCAGLIERFNWVDLKEKVLSFRPTPLSEILMQAIDEDAHYEMINLGMRWDIARDTAVRIINYFLLEEKIKIKVRDKEVLIPKHSRGLKIASIDVLNEPLTDDGSVSLAFIGIYDGEDVKVSKVLKEFYSLKSENKELEFKILEMINEGFVFLIWDKDSFYSKLNELGLRSLVYLFIGLEKEGKIVGVQKEIKKALKLENAPLEEVVNGFGWNFPVPLQILRAEYENTRRKIKNMPYSKWMIFTKYLTQKSIKYLEDVLKSIYNLYLVSKKWRNNKSLFK